MAIDIVARALAVSGKQNLSNYYTKTEINGKLDGKQDKLEPGVNLLGKDGITIEKAADSEKIEVSGKNLIKDPYPGVNVTGAGIVNYKPHGSADWGSAFIRNTPNLVNNAGYGAIVGYDNYGVIYAKTTSDNDYSVVNKKYAEDNFRKALETEAGQWKIYASKEGNSNDYFWTGVNVLDDHTIVVRGNNGCIYTNMPNAENTKDTTVPNKKYVEDNFVKKNPSNDRFVYGKNLVGSTLQETIYYVDQGNFSQVGRIPCWIAPDLSHTLASVNNPVTAKVSTPVGEADIANKKYVDDAIAKVFSVTIYEAGD